MTKSIHISNSRGNIHNVNHVDVQRIFHGATTGSSSHNIFLRASSRRSSRNRGTSSNAADTVARPCVADIFIVETVKVGIQDNHITLADFHSVSGELQVGTHGIDGEIGSGNTGRSIVSDRCRVNTRKIGGQRRGISLRLRTSPIHFVVTRTQRDICSERRRRALANHVVTRNGNFGNRVNLDRVVCRRRSRIQTNVFRFSSEGVGTRSKEVQRNRRQILTRNFNAIHIPSVIIHICSIGVHRNHAAFAKVRTVQHRHSRSNCSLIDYIHRNAGKDLAIG